MGLLAACAGTVSLPPSPRAEKWVRSVAAGDDPDFRDDLDKSSLVAAIQRSLKFLEGVPAGTEFPLGELRLKRESLQETLKAFRDYLEKDTSKEPVGDFLRREFDLYEAVGFSGRRDGLLTAYFEPVLEGSRVRGGEFQYPLYRPPPDLVRVDLGKFRAPFAGERLAGRLRNGELVPYYSRKEIDQERALEGKGLEIIWLKDPVDLFFLHVQGSGRILLRDGSSLRVGYAASNGRPYRSIGRLLQEEGKIREEEMSLSALTEYLRNHPEEQPRVLNYNESYVFFRIVDDGPLGSLDQVLTPGRSVATDPRLYPPGALAYLVSPKPGLGAAESSRVPEPIERFVLNQDSGGAIRGSGRVDLFWGSGENAGRTAGKIKQPVRLFFLIKKGPPS